ncbi:hypothetical protein BDR03DRAFT_980712 [Suillus americanus]|nr:hypothetical protein BDR03DRAFT_980712 [Suillus americanus]
MNTLLHSWSMQDANFDSHFSHSHSYGTSSLEHDACFDDHHDMSTLETAGLARETKRRGTRQAMPPTPCMIPYPTTRPQGASKSTLSTTKASTSQTVMSESSIAKPSPIKLTEDIIDQTMKVAMKLVTRELFGEQAMSNDKTEKKDMLTQVIWDSVPHCFGPNKCTVQELKGFWNGHLTGKLTNTMTLDGPINHLGPSFQGYVQWAHLAALQDYILSPSPPTPRQIGPFITSLILHPLGPSS